VHLSLRALQHAEDVKTPRSSFEEWHRAHPTVTVLQSRAVTALFTVIRDKLTSPEDFAVHADRLMTSVAVPSVSWWWRVAVTVVRTAVVDAAAFSRRRASRTYRRCGLSLWRHRADCTTD
jgi:hypothetical protein